MHAPHTPLTLFVPCYVDYLRPQTGIAAVQVLETLGHPVDVREPATCCGQPLTNSGCRPEGEAVTGSWYRTMAGAGTVLVLSSSCTAHLLAHGPEAPPRPDQPRVIEICEFLATRHGERSFGSLPATVCLHPSCHGLRGSGSHDAARRLLGLVEDLQVVSARRAEECCGFGGTFSTSFPGMSLAMGADRLAEIAATGTAELVATDVSCLLHLEGISRAARRGGSTAAGPELRIRHVVEVLRDAMASLPIAERR